MKKTFLLTASALLISAAAMAQMTSSAVKQNVAVSKFMTAKKAEAMPTRDAKPSKANRSASNGIYYARPEGTLYRAMDKEAMGWPISILATAPQNDNVYINMCDNAARAIWRLDDEQYPGDNNNNFEFGSLGTVHPPMDGIINHLYYVPTISVGVDEYTLGESNADGCAIHVDEVAGHQFYDDNTASTYGFGAYDTGFLFGNGIINFSNEPNVDYYGYGVTQDYPSPGYPLYVEDIYALVYTDGGAPLSGDTKLYLTVTDKEGNVIATLTAGAEDCSSEPLFSSAVQYTKTGMAAGYVITFSNKEKDAFGNDMSIPFVLDDEFSVTIEGMHQAGVNCGFLGAELCAEDDNIIGDGAVPMITDGENIYHFTYSGTLSLGIIFNSCYDYVDVPTELYAGEDVYENTNVLKVSADGTQAVVESTGYPVVYISNAFEWFDMDDEEQYIFDELPDWITGYEVEDLIDDKDERTGLCVVQFAFEPLPAGVTGRTAKIHVVGKGVTSENAIIIQQGEVSDAIENVAATTSKKSASYNIAGQRVNGNAKGIVIKNGQKIVKK